MERFPVLGVLASEWESCVLEAYTRGHDVQLHVHPQWSRASYEGNRWTLDGDWNICNYSEDQIRELISRCKKYLEGLIRRVDPQYTCVAFRSGSWCAAPSSSLFPVLVSEGIRLDMSLVGGLFYDLPVCKLDYRELEEDFLPYYPNLSDARRLGSASSGIVCCPTFSFWSRYAGLRSLLGPFLRRLPFVGKPAIERPAASYPILNNETTPNYKAVWGGNPSTIERLVKLVRGALVGSYFISDLAQLPPWSMDIMLEKIEEGARKNGTATTVIFLENHTKDIGSIAPLRYFCERLRRKAGVFSVITTSEAARRLAAGKYPIKSAPRQ